MRKSRLPLALAIALGSIACGTSGTPAEPSPTGDAQKARAHLEEVINLMQANSMNRLTIDWTTFRSNVLARGAGAQSIADTQPAIRLALELLHDGHSSYRSASGTVIFVGTRTCSAPEAAAPTVPSTVGYVRVRAVSGTADGAAVARDLQATIASADGDDLTGWVVDVRGNGGGNMWPMIAGVGPVLGEGVAGYFIDPAGIASQWEYRDGVALLNNGAAQSVVPPYRLRRAAPRVAVLTDNRIASSGEAVVVAFRGRPDTRSFGTPTCGLSTANRTYGLSEGATLVLSVSVMADRTKTKYGDSIVPDEIVTDPADVVQRAVAWLSGRS